MEAEKKGAKTTEFYQTGVLYSKFATALRNADLQYTEQVKKEGGAENDERLRFLSDGRAKPIITITSQPNNLPDRVLVSERSLVTENDLPKMRLVVERPADFSRDLLADGLSKEFGCDVQANNIEASSTGTSFFKTRQLIISLDNILLAPPMQEPSRSP